MAKKQTAPALVPEAEQPYPIPSNWRWVRLGAVCEFIGGGTPNKKVPSYWNGDISWASVKDIKGQYLTVTIDHITEEGLQNSASNLCDRNDLLLVTRIEPGKSIIAGITAAVNQDLKIVKSPLPVRFLYYFFETFRQEFLDQSRGTTVKGISVPMIQKFPFPLPPLPEQQRIVDRIDRLFTKLYAAQEKAQAVVDGYELRRAAILHKAFTGELTAKWREKQGIGLGTWKETRFDDCIHKMQNGLAKRTGETGIPYVVLRLANLSDEGFVTDNLREILLDEKEQSAYELHESDAIMVRVNGSRDNVGKQYLITHQKNWAFCDHIIRIVYNQNVLPAYMLYFSKGIRYRLYISDHMVTTAGQNTISRKGMSSLYVPVPQIMEQKEIVRILDRLLTDEQRTRDAAETVLTTIDVMKKKILGMAFRGLLGTNNPAEACAGLPV